MIENKTKNDKIQKNGKNMKSITLEIRGNIGIITLNNDRRLNVINQQLINDLKLAREEFFKHEPKVIILKSNRGSKVWSAGHDISELPEPGNDPLHRRDALPKLVRAIESFPAPIIAQIEGSVWGGANEMMVACDLIVAAKSSTFCITPAKLGVPYSVSGLINFIKAVPKHVLNELLFTASPMSAQKLLDVGVINHAVPVSQLDEFTMTLAQNICMNSSIAIKAMKETLRVLSTVISIPTTEIERLEDLRRDAYSSLDYKEGLEAIRNKRKPIFKNKNEG